jgi:hypothetical protein
MASFLELLEKTFGRQFQNHEAGSAGLEVSREKGTPPTLLQSNPLRGSCLVETCFAKKRGSFGAESEPEKTSQT